MPEEVTPSETNVWIGCETGLLKAVNLNKKLATNHFEEGKYGRDFEIKSIIWDNTSDDVLYNLHKNGVVSEFNISNGKYVNFTNIPKFHKGAKLTDFFQFNETQFATCTMCGKFSLWDGNSIKKEIPVGDSILAMTRHPENPKIFATGGKDNGLKLWDIENGKSYFRAKNQPDNWLKITVPQWVTGIQFATNSKEVLTATGLGKIHMYDPSGNQRKPCVELTLDEYPITAIGTTPNINQVIAADTHGTMAMFDWRSKKLLHKYKGIAGSIRSIKCHSTMPYIASCGLDRHLRLHHMETRMLEHKVYLKSRLNCLLVSKHTFTTEKDKVEKPEVKRKVNEDSDSEDDEVWGKMDKIRDNSNVNKKREKK